MNDKSYKNIPKRVLIVKKMDKKQTAVEWLFEKINDALIDFSAGKISAAVYGIRATEYKYQAKQMEKEQSFEFWQGGINCTEEGGKSFEQYYNETYKGGEQ